MASTSKNEKSGEAKSTFVGVSSKDTVHSTQKQNVSNERVLFTWRATSRPFRKRSREYWVTVISIASLLAFILFLAEGTMPVILISSLVFLYYILSTVKPEEIDYGISNWGIRIADTTATWDNLTQFWFTQRMGNDLLVVETPTFPFRLELVIEQKDIVKAKEVLNNYIPEGRTTPTYLDKTVDWVSKKLPNSQ